MLNIGGVRRQELICVFSQRRLWDKRGRGIEIKAYDIMICAYEHNTYTIWSCLISPLLFSSGAVLEI